ncbi:uncharacterized protein LOC126735423 [Anthonomus grandis grandis]|uniref:uncharacterized protein LOC126735423 n=1 Tax=Anthonomus grandis grandis TaxID=2921223 RepID=UPI002165743C|nr:uncharacterized protein LOC126735423 [Anthonomus grandis grandis]
MKKSVPQRNHSPQVPPQEMQRCRLCLEKCSNSIEIFKDDFPKMIYNLTRLKVWPDDRMPNISCISCALEVKQAMLVRKKILRSYKALLTEINPQLNKDMNYKISQENQRPPLDTLRYGSPPPLAPLTEDYEAAANVSIPEGRSENYNYQQGKLNYIPEQDSNFTLFEGSTDGNCFEMISRIEDGEYEQIIISVEPEQNNEAIFKEDEQNNGTTYVQQTYEEQKSFEKKRKVDLSSTVQEHFPEQTGSGVKVKFRKKPEDVACCYCNKIFLKYNLEKHMRNCSHIKDIKLELDLMEVPEVPLQPRKSGMKVFN